MVLVLVFDGDATILRQSPFGNVTIGHDLEACHHAKIVPQQIIRIFFPHLQPPINAEAYAGDVTERFDVDVACARRQRRMQDMIADLRDQLLIVECEAHPPWFRAWPGLLFLWRFNRCFKRRFDFLVAAQRLEIAQRDQLELDIQV